MARRDGLASNPSVSLDQMDGRHWILFERQLHPPVYDAIIEAAAQRGVRPRSIQHVIAPEEAFPLVSDGFATAFVVKAGALLMALQWSDRAPAERVEPTTEDMPGMPCR
jgi:hypothetical protein